MKKYLAVLHGNSRMGEAPSYQLLEEDKIKSIKLYGEFVRLYELASPNPITKEQAKHLGLSYLYEDKA